MKRTIIIATGNQGKVKEFKALLKPLDFNVIAMNEAGINADIVEDGETFEENARIKALEVYRLADSRDVCVLADDSGLEVDYLNGEPGVRSARFAPVGERRKTLLKMLDGVPWEKRTARFVSCICYIDENGNETIIRGECSGYVGYENMGGNGFGYDPIFMIDEKTSMAMIGDEEKNKISHRGKALRALVKAL